MQDTELESRLKILENNVMSLNTLWKMAVIVQGPRFTDTLIADLANAIMSEPSNPVFRDAKEGLENAMKAWSDQTGENFGFEDERTRQKARILTLEFLFGLSLIQQGPNAIRAFLKNTESAYIKSSSPEEDEVFLEEAHDTLNSIRNDLMDGLKQWGQQWTEHQEVHRG